MRGQFLNKIIPLCALLLLPLTSQAQRQDGFALYADRYPTEAEAAANFTGAKFEPRTGCYAGAFIDLDDTILETFKDKTGKVRRLPWAFESVVGKQHATYFYYMGYGRPLATDWITKLGQDDKIVHIALEPNNGLDYVKDDEYLTNFAQQLGATETPVFLRFASEMNGPWTKYNGNPAKYIEKFRLIAKKMRTYAPNVAMVWCPYATPVSPIPDYYPGDEYVDWVGVNIYSVTFYDQNPRLSGKNDHPVEKLDYIYNRYAKKKPIMIGEYGATHFSALEDKSTTDFATRSILGIYESLPRKYPRVKCINYFNTNNLTLEHRKNNNYAVTQNPAVLALYRKIIGQPYFLSAPTDQHGYLASAFLALPVSGEKSPPLLPIQPKPVVQKQVLSDVVRLSGWIEDPTGKTNMHFYVDGVKVYVGTKKEDWAFNFDTAIYPNGRHELMLKAEKDGKTVGAYKISITISNN
jgi:hypothetical protein